MGAGKWNLHYENGFVIPYDVTQFKLLNPHEVLVSKPAVFMRGNQDNADKLTPVYNKITELHSKIDAQRAKYEQDQDREINNIVKVVTTKAKNTRKLERQEVE